MTAKRVQAFLSQRLGGERVREAALFAAVTTGVGVAVAEPTMA